MNKSRKAYAYRDDVSRTEDRETPTTTCMLGDQGASDPISSGIIQGNLGTTTYKQAKSRFKIYDTSRIGFSQCFTRKH